MKNILVNKFIDSQLNPEPLTFLRSLILKTGLIEDFKWSSPVYTYQNKNVVGLAAFKSYFGLWFFQGAFMQDPLNVLMNAQSGKTISMRQWRFKKLQDCFNAEVYIIDYLENAKQIVISNKVNLNLIKTTVQYSNEFVDELKSDINLWNTFLKLPPSHQKEHYLYYSEAKKIETRLKRMNKIKEILNKK